MTRTIRTAALLAALGTAMSFNNPAIAAAPGTTFTYQGALTLNGQPVNTEVEIAFLLFDAEVAGNIVGSPIFVQTTPVDGIFTAELDFGVESFEMNQQLWLEMQVSNLANPSQMDTFRQPLTATPFALNTRGIEVAPLDGTALIGVTNPNGPVTAVFPQNIFNPFGGSILMGTPGGLMGMIVRRFAEDGSNDFSWNFGLDTDNGWKMWKTDGGMPSSPFLFSFSEDGDLGVGTAAPQRKLHVRGTNGVVRIDRSDFEPAIDFFDYAPSDDSFQGDPIANWFMFAGADGFAISDRSVPNQIETRFFIDRSSTGNVGIGTLNPERKLDVNGSARFSSAEVNGDLVVDGTSSSQNVTATGTVATGSINATGVNHGGSFGTGDFPGAFGTQLIGIYSGGSGNGPQQRFEGSGGFIDIGQNGTGSFVVETNDIPRFVVAQDGNIAIGPTFFNNVALNIDLPRDFGLNLSQGDAGKPGGGSWANTSDVRLKQNIVPIEGALDTLLDLRGVHFEYKDPKGIGELEGQRTGFIAQEVEAVLPDWVWEAEDGYKRMTVRGFEALAVEALREQQAMIEMLEARIAELEAR